RGIHLMEGDVVLASPVRRRLHARQDYHDATFLRTLDDLRQIVLELLRRQRAQRVVAAQCDDEDLDVALQRPIESRQPSSRGVARYAGVDDVVVESGIFETLLEKRR